MPSRVPGSTYLKKRSGPLSGPSTRTATTPFASKNGETFSSCVAPSKSVDFDG